MHGGGTGRRRTNERLGKDGEFVARSIDRDTVTLPEPSLATRRLFMATFAEDMECIRNECRRELLEEVMPFWNTHGVDAEHGGFICGLGHAGNVVDDSKFAWYQGRGVWVYCKLYEVTGDKKLLDIARMTVAFILEHCCVYESSSVVGVFNYDPLSKPDNQHIKDMWTVVARDGSFIEGRTEIDNVGYALMFLAEGLQELARFETDTVQRQSYLKWSVELVKTFVARANAPSRNAPETYLLSQPYQKGTRTLGHSMIPLRFCTQALRQHSKAALGNGNHEYLNGLAEACVKNIMEHHYDAKWGLLREELDHDFQPLNAPTLFYLGHAIECLWFVIDEATRVKNPELVDQAAVRLKRHATVAWDELCGGLIRGITIEADHNDKFMFDKVAWVQQEALVGTMLCIERCRDPAVVEWATGYFQKLYSWVREKFPLSARLGPGTPLWLVGGDREVTFQEEYSFGDAGLKSRKENYHHPRTLLMLSGMMSTS